MKNIIIKRTRQHNLKNISVTIPRDELVVIKGLASSGKSTLASGTLYVESLSAYARQFLGLIQKPDVDSTGGSEPAGVLL